MSDALYLIGQNFVRRRRLKKFCNYVYLGVDEALKLLSASKQVSIDLVQGVEGSFNPGFFSYFFVLDGIGFYFESKKKVNIEPFVQVKKIEVPE